MSVSGLLAIDRQGHARDEGSDGICPDAHGGGDVLYSRARIDRMLATTDRFNLRGSG
jgi:hypothetical protein